MIEVLHLIKMPAQVTELGAISVKNDVVFFERNDIFELVSGRDLYHILGIKVKTWSDHVLFLFAQIYIVECTTSYRFIVLPPIFVNDINEAKP